MRWRILGTLPVVKGKTPHAHIKDYKATWHHAIEGFIKVGTKGKELHAKWLELEVFVSNKHHHNLKLPEELRADEKQRIGKVSINLVEFAGVEGTLPMRYLLQESRINAVLNVEVGLTLAKGGQLGDYIIPPLSKSRGISSTLNESVHESVSGVSKGVGSGVSSPLSDHKFQRSLIITSDPVVARLYQRTFELSWDPRPGEFTADVCVDDILEGGDGWAKNEDGVNFVDLQLEQLNRYQAACDAQLDKSTTVKRGDSRPDMRSWEIHHVFH